MDFLRHWWSNCIATHHLLGGQFMATIIPHSALDGAGRNHAGGARVRKRAHVAGLHLTEYGVALVIEPCW